MLPTLFYYLAMVEYRAIRNGRFWRRCIICGRRHLVRDLIRRKRLPIAALVASVLVVSVLLALVAV